MRRTWTGPMVIAALVKLARAEHMAETTVTKMTLGQITLIKTLLNKERERS